MSRWVIQLTCRVALACLIARSTTVLPCCTWSAAYSAFCSMAVNISPCCSTSIDMSASNWWSSYSHTCWILLVWLTYCYHWSLTTIVFSICLMSSCRFCTSASTCWPWLLRVVCTSYLQIYIVISNSVVLTMMGLLIPLTDWAKICDGSLESTIRSTSSCEAFGFTIMQ